MRELSIEAAADLVAKAFPQTKECSRRHECTGDMVWCKRCDGNGREPLSGADLLAKDEPLSDDYEDIESGRPSRALWHLWELRGEDLYVDRDTPKQYNAYTRNRVHGKGDTATDAMIRALAADAKTKS